MLSGLLDIIEGSLNVLFDLMTKDELKFEFVSHSRFDHNFKIMVMMKNGTKHVCEIIFPSGPIAKFDDNRFGWSPEWNNNDLKFNAPIDERNQQIESLLNRIILKSKKSIQLEINVQYRKKGSFSFDYGVKRDKSDEIKIRAFLLKPDVRLSVK